MSSYGLEGCTFSSNFILNFLVCSEGKLLVQDARSQSDMNVFELPEEITSLITETTPLNMIPSTTNTSESYINVGTQFWLLSQNEAQKQVNEVNITKIASFTELIEDRSNVEETFFSAVRDFQIYND